MVPAKNGELFWTVIDFSLAYLPKKVLIVWLQTVELRFYCDPDKIPGIALKVDLMLGKPYPWSGCTEIAQFFLKIIAVFTWIHLDDMNIFTCVAIQENSHLYTLCPVQVH